MALPNDRLWTAASNLLDVVVAHYAAEGVPLPDRQFVSDGTPAWDCEQVCVYVERLFSGTLEDENQRPITCLMVRGAQIAVEISRCTPVFAHEFSAAPPAADEIQGVAQTVLADSMLLTNAIVAGYRNDDLAGCHGLALVEWESLGPQGGLVGGRQRIRWDLSVV